MTSREFNQHLGQAQKSAQIAPVIITKRGEPSYVLMSYVEYEKRTDKKPFLSVADAFTTPNPAAVQPHSCGQRRPVDLED